MNFYFDTLDNEMFNVANKMIQKYNIKSIYTVSNETENNSLIHDNTIKSNSIIKQIYNRQELFLAEYENYIFWNICTPLDDKLLTFMHKYDLEILKMMERNGYQAKSFDKRVNAYYKHLMYWNSLLDNANINAAIFCYPPHAVHDYIIFRLCEYKKIPVVMSIRIPIGGNDYHIFFYDYKDMLPNLPNIIRELQEKYKSKLISEIDLPEDYQKEFDLYTKPEKVIKKIVSKKNKFPEYKILMWHWLRSPKNTIKKIINRLWQKLQTIHLLRTYNRLSIPADYTSSYIYFPLQYQPEMTTSPLGGVFVHQILAIRMLAHYIPSGTKIYVKEHPLLKHRTHTRDINLYYELKKMKQVQLIPLDTNSNKLIENSVAVASMTGTVGYEAMYKEKPFLMFGERQMKYSPSTFNIRNNDECKMAVEYVFTKGAKHTLKDAKLFLKALSMVAVKSNYVYAHDVTDTEREENCNRLFNAYSALLSTKLEER